MQWKPNKTVNGWPNKPPKTPIQIEPKNKQTLRTCWKTALLETGAAKPRSDACRIHLPSHQHSPLAARRLCVEKSTFAGRTTRDTKPFTWQWHPHKSAIKKHNLECNTCNHPKWIANTNHKVSKSINVKNKQTHKHTSGRPCTQCWTQTYTSPHLHECSQYRKKMPCSNEVKCAHTAKHLCKTPLQNTSAKHTAATKSMSRPHCWSLANVSTLMTTAFLCCNTCMQFSWKCWIV